jgi:hypothetical protein
MPEISKPMTTNPIDDHKAVIQHQLSCCPSKPGSSAATYVTKHQKSGRPTTTPATTYPQSRFVGMKPIFQTTVQQITEEREKEKKKKKN